MVCYSLGPENPTKSDKSRVQTFAFTLRTRVKWPRPSRAGVSERRHFAEANVSRAVAMMVELVRVPRPNGRAGHRVGGPREC